MDTALVDVTTYTCPATGPSQRTHHLAPMKGQQFVVLTCIYCKKKAHELREDIASKENGHG